MPGRNPFLYPRQRHARTLSPGPFRQYRTYKPYLRVEFAAQCVYCRLPDALKGADSFGVDHYLPKRYFKELALVYANLFYCCNACNSAKKSFWPKPKEDPRTLFVPNPCDHVMVEHLRYKGAEVVANSRTGKFAIDLLRLNDDASVKYREMYQQIIDNFYSQEAAEREHLNKLERLLSKEKDPGRRRLLESELRQLEALVATLGERIEELLSRRL